MLGYRFCLSQNFAQMLSRRSRLLTSRFDQLMRSGIANVTSESHGKALRENQALSRFQIVPHALCVNFEMRNSLSHLVKCSASQTENLRQRLPLRVPVAQTALVFLHHRAQHG